MSNPHYEAASKTLKESEEFLTDSWRGKIAYAEAEATLALAFEARTANLLTSQQIAHAALYKGGTLSAEAKAELIRSAKEIETRLGLGDTK